MKEFRINTGIDPKSTDSETATERFELFLGALRNEILENKRKKIEADFARASKENLSYEQIGVLVEEFQRRLGVLVRAESSFDSKVAIPVMNLFIKWLEDLEESYIEQVEPEDTSQDEAPQLSPEEYKQKINELKKQVPPDDEFINSSMISQWYSLHGFDKRTANTFWRNKFTPEKLLDMPDNDILRGKQIGDVTLGIWKEFVGKLISGKKTILPLPQQDSKAKEQDIFFDPHSRIHLEE